MRHVLEAQQFDRRFIETLFARTAELEHLIDQKNGQQIRLLEGNMMFTIFYEPSTRTRVSFNAAAQHLGMQVVSTENAREFSSAAKGETLEDTIKTLCQYRPDVIVLRHNETGAAERAAAISSVPIINAGDGMGQHPTQALLDLYTIQKELGRSDNLHVVIGGDLAHGRTARSLAYLLAKFKANQITFLAPPGLEIGRDITDHLTKQGTKFNETSDIESALKLADVVYWTRVQKERFDSSKLAQTFVIDAKDMILLKKDAILMHPLPRVDEITPAVDSDPRAAYFRQAGNGMFIRMALLEWVLEKNHD
ncbi:MAG TPA: aspartate carbamoyltransferase [Candidatus Saccharimonadales bacterium]|nr:aspartate carbamoyltransferase [Candidatus Saccharimonadales bacterium]